MAKFFKSELTVSYESNARSKNLIGVLISVLVLMVISSMIVAAIVIINPEIVNIATKQMINREAITLEEAFLDELTPNNVPFQWVPSSHKQQVELLIERNNNLLLLDVNNATSLDRPWPLDPNGMLEDARVLVANTSLLSSIDYQGFKVSPSKRYLLIWTMKRRIFRHSFLAKFFLYDIQQDLISVLSTKQSLATGDPASTSSQAEEEEQYMRFQSVDWFESRRTDQSLVEDSLILIQNNDIYLLLNLSGSQEDHNNNNDKINNRMTPKQLTFTGKQDEIFNGIADWLYEEEILGDTVAYQVSPSSSTLAYMSFNDSLVELMPFTIYGSSEQIIPKTVRIRYPKTGRVNPRVSVHLVDRLNEGHDAHMNIQLRLPVDLANRQHYIYRIKWLGDDYLALTWLNRNQNESHIVVCSRQFDWRCDSNLHFASPGGWLEIGDDIHPLDDNHYLALLPKDEGPDVGAFKQIAKVSLKQGNSFTFLTGGRKEVLSIEGVDPNQTLVYYSSTLEGEPGQRHLYSAPLFTEHDSINSYCITCQIYPSECLYNYARLSPSSRYFIYLCEGPGIPKVELRHLATSYQRYTAPSDGAIQKNNSGDNSGLIWVIEDNKELRDKLTYTKAMPITMRLKVPIPNTDYQADVIMLLPPQLGSTTNLVPVPVSTLRPAFNGARIRSRRSSQPANGLDQQIHSHLTPDTISQYTNQLSSGQQYPMVVDVYAGPNSQKVDYRFNLNLGHYLASSRRTIYAMIDGRGSANQGTKRSFEMRHKFGTVEIQDQIDVTAFLVRNYSFIDHSKVAIWGWSYGGYAAAMALAQSNSRNIHLHSTRQVQPFNQLALSGISNYSTFPKLNANLPQSLSNTSYLNAGGVFECAASVAPVTNWIFYDTAYTEKFMSSPYSNGQYDLDRVGDHNAPSTNDQVPINGFSEDKTNRWLHLNESLRSQSAKRIADLMRPSQLGGRLSNIDLNERYRNASLLEHATNIDKKRYLLVHGTADDNVHFQQSIMLMKRLIHKNVLFETRLYPDQNHNIANRADKLHLGSTLSNFFAECFDMTSP